MAEQAEDGHGSLARRLEIYHEPPAIRTRLADGTRLRIVLPPDDHLRRIGDARLLQAQVDGAVGRPGPANAHELWKAKGYFMQHDEIRIMNWDQASQDRNLDAGQILADNVKQCATSCGR